MKSLQPLFQDKVEIAVAVSFFVFIFCINLCITYIDFRDFKSQNWATVRGEIANVIFLVAKDGRDYKRLYVKSDNAMTISIAYFAKDNLTQNMRVGFRVKTENVAFAAFLSRRFFTPAVLVWAEKKEEKSVKESLQDKIEVQHKNPLMQELYSTLFLATPISKALRDQVQRWGVTHIIAISGFHLSIIFGFLYLILAPIYRFFQNRYFPYRNMKWDISVAIFTFLGYYLWLIDMTPSFLRSYAMGVCGFLFLWRGIQVLSFEMLFFVSLMLISLFPHLLFNIGFTLSVFGVFFIFVFVKHFGNTLKVWQSAIFINIWLFIAMNPIVFYYFGLINLQQWASIPLSIMFIVFYPLVSFLHLIGHGGILDSCLISFLSFKTESILFNTPLWLLFIYVAFSLAAAFWRIFMLGVLLVGLSYFSLFLLR